MPPRKPRTGTPPIDPEDIAPPLRHPDVAGLMDLMLWARLKGFRVGPIIEVGSVKMTIEDIRQSKQERIGEPPGDDGPTDPYTEGGAVDVPADGTVG